MSTKLIMSNSTLTASVKYFPATGRYLITFLNRANKRIYGQVFSYPRDRVKMAALLKGFLPVYICE